MVPRRGGSSPHQSPKCLESNDIPLFDIFEEDFVPKSVILFSLKSFQTHCVLHASVTVTVWPIHIKSCQKHSNRLVITKQIVTTWSRLKCCRSAFGRCVCREVVGSYIFISSHLHCSKTQVYLQSRSFKSKSSLTKKIKKSTDYLKPWCFSSGSQHQAFSASALIQMGKWLIASQSCFFLYFFFVSFLFLPFLSSLSSPAGMSGLSDEARWVFRLGLIPWTSAGGWTSISLLGNSILSVGPRCSGHSISDVGLWGRVKK